MQTPYRRRIGWGLIVLIVTMLTAGGCASLPTIVGKWGAVEGTATVNFTAEGEFHAIDNQGMPVSGKYKRVGLNGIQFEILHGGGESERVDARISQAGERLTLSFPDGNTVETYERIP